jgi:hypothetical protein
MEVVDMCMLSNSHQGRKKNYDMSVIIFFFWLGPTNKLSNFGFIQ